MRPLPILVRVGGLTRWGYLSGSGTLMSISLMFRYCQEGNNRDYIHTVHAVCHGCVIVASNGSLGTMVTSSHGRFTACWGQTGTKALCLYSQSPQRGHETQSEQCSRSCDPIRTLFRGHVTPLGECLLHLSLHVHLHGMQTCVTQRIILILNLGDAPVSTCIHKRPDSSLFTQCGQLPAQCLTQGPKHREYSIS